VRFAGELTALGAACCWAIGSNLFAAAGRRIGPVEINRLRITVAMVLLGLTLWVTRGSPWPFQATGTQLALMALSGLIGFVFGDTWYFRALVVLGAGRAALIASLAPLFTAALGWPLLSERLGPLAWLGMALTLGGVALVLAESPGARAGIVAGKARAGVIAGILAALGQAGGYVTSKLALRTGMDALSGTMIRVTAACVTMWLLATIEGQVSSTVAALRDRRASLFLTGGAFFGAFLGVTLSLAALKEIEAGVAPSITPIYPVLTLLMSARFHREPVTARTLVGALVAVGGVVVLFLR
jgi:drug/metabolite transporter (DMT)-like permease